MIASEVMDSGFASDDAELNLLLDQMSVEELERLNSEVLLDIPIVMNYYRNA